MAGRAGGGGACATVPDGGLSTDARAARDVDEKLRAAGVDAAGVDKTVRRATDVDRMIARLLYWPSSRREATDPRYALLGVGVATNAAGQRVVVDYVVRLRE